MIDFRTSRLLLFSLVKVSSLVGRLDSARSLATNGIIVRNLAELFVSNANNERVF